MKKRRTIDIKRTIFLALVLFIVSRVPESYGTQGEKRLEGNDIEVGRSFQQTTDGGYVIAGSIRSYGEESDLYLVKTDGKGNKLWSKTLGGDKRDEGHSIDQTADGGYIIVGFTESFGAGLEDVYLIKTDAEGNELWSRTIGGTKTDLARSVKQTVDGGYIIVGSTWSFSEKAKVYLIKTDKDGNELWNANFGGGDEEEGYAVQQTADEGYIIAGSKRYFSLLSYDVYLLKTDATGREIWSKTVGGTDIDLGYSVQQTKDGGYIITGSTWPLGYTSNVYLLKIDDKGTILWTRTFGGRDLDSGYSVKQTRDGGYIIVGQTWTRRSDSFDVYLIKTDGKGNELWSKTFGGGGHDYGYSVEQTLEGGYVVVGHTRTVSFASDPGDLYLIKVDTNGNQLWSRAFGKKESD
jgi:outer membrane protein assembly factor BamB